MKVGISIIVKPEESLFKNGIIQNCLYAYDVIKNISFVDRVTLLQISLPDQVDLDSISFLKEYDKVYWYDDNLDFIREEFDVIITLGGIPSTIQTLDYKSNRKNRLVAYKGGNEFVNKIETIIYSGISAWPNVLEKLTLADIPRGFDEVWMVPQQEFNNKEYFEIRYSAPVKSTPFLWDPKFIEQRANIVDPDGGCLFSNKEFDSWTFACFEPNMSILKNLIPPIYAAEAAYSMIENKDDIESFMFTNAAGLTTNKKLIKTVKDLKIYKDKKTSFEARYGVVDILHRYAHGVISHQWGNALNYAYLDVCYFGYPLIHNGHLCADLGYYYEEWKIKQAGKRIVEAVNHHKEDKDYMIKQRDILKRYSPSNEDVIQQYALLLSNLFEKNEIEEANYNWKSNLLE